MLKLLLQAQHTIAFLAGKGVGRWVRGNWPTLFSGVDFFSGVSTSDVIGDPVDGVSPSIGRPNGVPGVRIWSKGWDIGSPKSRVGVWAWGGLEKGLGGGGVENPDLVKPLGRCDMWWPLWNPFSLGTVSVGVGVGVGVSGSAFGIPPVKRFFLEEGGVGGESITTQQSLSESVELSCGGTKPLRRKPLAFLGGDIWLKCLVAESANDFGIACPPPLPVDTGVEVASWVKFGLTSMSSCFSSPLGVEAWWFVSALRPFIGSLWPGGRTGKGAVTGNCSGLPEWREPNVAAGGAEDSTGLTSIPGSLLDGGSFSLYSGRQCSCSLGFLAYSSALTPCFKMVSTWNKWKRNRIDKTWFANCSGLSYHTIVAPPSAMLCLS